MAWLIGRICEAAERWPDTVAVVTEDKSHSRRELMAGMLRVAGGLARRGVRAGDRVGVLAARTTDHVVALLGVLRAGATYMPLDPTDPLIRLDGMLVRSGARVVLDATGSEIKKLPGALTVAELVESGDETCCPPLASLGEDSSSLVYVIHTSGSTGEPKGAGVYHAGFRNLLEWYLGETGLGTDDAVLVISSPTFDLTQKNLFAPLVCGARLVLSGAGPYDLGRVRELICRHRVTLLNCTPSAFYPLIEQATDGQLRQLESLRHVVLGGEPITAARVRPWLLSEHCHADVLNTYGPTECTDIALFYRLNRSNHHLRENVPVGHPLPNVHVAIVNESLGKVLPGQPGELVIGGAGVGAGYLGDAEKTSRAFPNNPFPEWPGHRIYRTGDRARQLPNGMIEYLGRMDHQVKIRGFRVELGEIEAALRSHESVRDAVVVAAGDSTPDSLVGFVTLNNRVPPISPDELRLSVSALLPDYMMPREVRILDELPTTRHGKTDRLALTAQANESAGVIRRPVVEPDTPLERMILALWQEVIGRRDFGVTDAFLEVGGTSLHIAIIHAKMQKELGRGFPITRLLGHPTVRALADSFESEEKAAVRPSLPARQPMDAAERARRSRERLAQHAFGSRRGNTQPE